jgi:hypothetical protein
MTSLIASETHEVAAIVIVFRKSWMLRKSSRYGSRIQAGRVLASCNFLTFGGKEADKMSRVESSEVAPDILKKVLHAYQEHQVLQFHAGCSNARSRDSGLPITIRSTLDINFSSSDSRRWRCLQDHRHLNSLCMSTCPLSIGLLLMNCDLGLFEAFRNGSL